MKNYIERPVWVLAVAGTAAALVSGCSPKIRSEAIGKWRTADSNQMIEFRTDGKCEGTDQYGRQVSGNFAFVDSEHIKLDMTMSSEDKVKGLRFVEHSTSVAQLVVNGNDLVLTEQGHSPICYQRQK